MAESAPIRVSGRLQSVVGEVGKIPNLASVVFAEVLRTRVLTIGAAVAFFFLLSLVPLLGVASALLSALPDVWRLRHPDACNSFTVQIYGSRPQ